MNRRFSAGVAHVRSEVLPGSVSVRLPLALLLQCKSRRPNNSRWHVNKRMKRCVRTLRKVGFRVYCLLLFFIVKFCNSVMIRKKKPNANFSSLQHPVDVRVVKLDQEADLQL